MATEPKATKDPIDADAEDSDDEDYNPEQDTEAKVEDELDAKEEQEFLRKHAAKQPMATNASKRKVDDLWADMNADTAVSATSTSKTAKLLHKLVQGPPKKKKTTKVREFHMPIMGCSGKSRGGAPLKQDATVTQVLKFAGQEYTVKKSAADKKTGLDAIVDALQQPKKVSTIEKSSMDWDSFKEKEGIVDELEQYTKDGYLEKKDFLHRVDLRKFELEKAEREKVRRANN
ncbi:hypothetical protein SDRG_06864 [Saprolegnia diclina VS20]|uniref:BCNT-C domain-containing protein n=1 Tax=Saprolegnia diclina (strain VS20) TaxID=1156394 RepID=T0QP06_SAPDV|nr:hypothetical protein SDRG_06864 [Saprolegnia diclina VS20]EQC35575.1 hypothetical protein SDRG_06864 [Saprolegnia diclina VS20]|eukprot:XP_008610892.1 hypothetical protein SDRG_06864 [Saprolegnia diclina VS20]